MTQERARRADEPVRRAPLSGQTRVAVTATPNRAPVTIAPLTGDHARQAARLHIAGQPGTFLTQLGEDALTLFYTALPEAGFGFVAHTSPPDLASNGTLPAVKGFISGTAGLGPVLRQTLMGAHGRRGVHLIWLLAMRTFRRPRLLVDFAATLNYALRNGPAPANHAEMHAIELLSIMIEPAARSQGIGSQLMHRFLDECRSQGASAVHVTVDAGNQGAQRFYVRHDFQLEHTFQLYGRAMTNYRKVLV